MRGRGGGRGPAGWRLGCLGCPATGTARCGSSSPAGFWAVSGASITIGGDGASVTAAVTATTTVTGKVHSIGGVKVGDEVSAQISSTASHLTATAIQDPADNSSTS